ncbi:uncharacterized protein LOC112682999 isoform X2 [Sipha flava]|uniref:Uncharacterized protein LOC112682999 isoform X2 n=1 Tax=Sipha flava TaxID=143950 RepID=A0A8B8FFR7_9HEMI|nr:uncharacterized protein LOC112682999 isoform X2 [Sipha flava]
MSLYFISIVMMWSCILSGDHSHVFAGPLELQCKNCYCKGITEEKCPFQKCQQLWDDCILKRYNDESFMTEYFKQKEIAVMYIKIPFRNLHKYLTFLSYSSEENVTTVSLSYNETSTARQIFNTPSSKNEQLSEHLPVKFGTNQSLKMPILSSKKIIALDPSYSMLDNNTNAHAINERENLLVFVDLILVLLWLTNVIVLCVCLRLRRSDSARRQNPVLNRLRIDKGRQHHR